MLPVLDINYAIFTNNLSYITVHVCISAFISDCTYHYKRRRLINNYALVSLHATLNAMHIQLVCPYEN